MSWMGIPAVPASAILMAFCSEVAEPKSTLTVWQLLYLIFTTKRAQAVTRGAAMTYRGVIPMSMVLAVLISEPIQAAFPEDEFSRHDGREMRQDRDDRHDLQHHNRDIRADRQDESAVPHDRQRPRVDERNGASAGQLQQDRQHLRHAGQDLRQNRRDLRIDRQNRKQNRREVRKERREMRRDRQDLRADHGGLRGGPHYPSGGDR